MSIYLVQCSGCDKEKQTIGISNYIKVLFSTYRVNSIINPEKFTPCVSKTTSWLYDQFYENKEYIYEGEWKEEGGLAFDNCSMFLDNALFAWEGSNRLYYFKENIRYNLQADHQSYFPNQECTHSTCGWKFYVMPSDNINCEPFQNQLMAREPNSIDLKYTNIPQNIRDLYLSIIEKFRIIEPIRNHVNSQVEKIGGDYLSVHIRTWNTFGNLSDQRSSNDRYNWYLSQRDNFVNAINRNPLKKCFISTDNMDEIKQLLPNIIDKEIYFYEKNSDLTDLQNDFSELLTLSKCNYFIGSNLSTFSELSWWYGGCKAPVEIY